jgi:hypothetical protein
MTTGRINQVTVLNPGTPRRVGAWEAPEGAEPTLPRLGDIPRDEPSRRRPRGRSRPSYCPHRVPQEAVRRGRDRARRPPKAATCTPREESDTPQVDAAEGGYLARAIPQVCCRTVAIATRPRFKIVCACQPVAKQGFGPSAAGPGASGRKGWIPPVVDG